MNQSSSASTQSSSELSEVLSRCLTPSLMPVRYLNTPRPQPCPVIWALSFLRRSMIHERDLGDQYGAMALASVSEVLQNMDAPTDALRRRAEAEAYDYIANYTDLLAEAGASTQLLEGYQCVLQVLAALDLVRKQELLTGVLTSYARVQEVYEAMYVAHR